MKITWLKHAGFLLETNSGKKIFIDPFQIVSNWQADIILCTHSHFDHFSKEDIEKIRKPDTIIVATGDCEKLSGDQKSVKPGETLPFDDVEVKTVRAYNTNKNFHPKKNNWVGYIVTVDGESVYHAGDTDLIKEMEEISCDIALLPVSGTYVMSASEAAEATRRIDCKKAIPMHFGGGVVGSKKDAEEFKEKANCDVEILNPLF
ncbi:MAG: MBL fold metallo-hydrolase [Spirochaetes bacterium]|nr:MAG: MBL fold metallo-hydrolase [Spirochaetota bacterium]